jgi:hypothetical protein
MSKYLPQHSVLKIPQSMFLPQSLGFLIRDGETKDFGPNSNKRSLNLIYSWFHHECHSDLLPSSNADVKTRDLMQG